MEREGGSRKPHVPDRPIRLPLHPPRRDRDAAVRAPFDHRPWSTFGEGDKIAPYNPLRRVPTLVLDDGEALIESTATWIISMSWWGRSGR